MKHQIKLIAVATAAALTASHAMALEVYNDKGWKLDISGSVNAFYTSTKADNKNTSTSIENGLLPGYLNVTATTQQKGWDIKGVIGYWPGINSNGAGVAGVGKTTADVRTNYLSFGKSDVGTFKFGRDVGLFQSNAILNDMTLIGVGGGAGAARNINTTLGGIGAGYVYCEFQPQITYTTPSANGFSLSVGVFDNKDTSATNATATTGSSPGFQALAEYAFKGATSGKVWGGLISQKFSNATIGSAQQGTANGGELGILANVGNFGMMAEAYSGQGLGSAVLFSDGFDTRGNTRASNGYLLQATYKIGDLKLGTSYGRSRLQKNAIEGASDVSRTNGTTLGAYYSLTPNVTLVAELNSRKEQVTAIKTDSASFGAILFF
ncbi:MAG: porin [Rhodocyclaceae bacterium]|nr:porin [Rhodocyclaceae bacterium]